MEESEKEQIMKLLPDLLQVTVCSPIMITYLRSRQIFSLADESLLESIPNKVDRTIKMFQLLQTRVDGYKHLIESLKHTRQTGALKLLLGEDFDISQISPENYFGLPESPKYVQVSESVKRLLEENEDRIERKRRALSVQEKVLLFNVKPHSKLFTGRSKELDELRQALGKSSGSAVISQHSSISGLGGIGKTELAKKFIHSIDFNAEDPLFNCVVWINSDSQASAERDFKNFATSKLQISTLNANGTEEEISSVLDKVYARIKLRKTLLVFDNMENPDLLEKYRPSDMQEIDNIAMLITSQTSNWDIGHHIRLSGMREEDAIEFVKKGLGLPLTPNAVQDPEISKLVSRLQHFPLAISQAIAYIKNKRITTTSYGPLDYISDLDTRTKTLFTQSLSGTGTLYKKTIYHTVELTLAKLEEDENFGQTASRLVKVLAYMVPDNVTEAMLVDLGECLDDVLILLERYAVINITPREKEKSLNISIHRLVQEVLRTIIVARKEENKVLTDSLELLDGKINFHSVDHILSVWRYANHHNDLVRQFSHYPSKITETLNNLMRTNEAQKFASEELDRLKQNFSYSENAKVLVTLEFVIGECIHIQGKFVECKDYVSAILENALKYLTDSDEIILKLQTLKVASLVRLYDYDEALNTALKTYDSWKIDTNNTEANIYVLRLLLEIGNINLALKNYVEALSCFENIIKHLPQKNDEVVHNLAVNSKRLLASTKSRMGDAQAALKEMQEAVAYAKKHLHPKHKRSLIAKNDLGVSLYRCGFIKEAADAFEEVYDDYLKFYGPDHTDTLFAKQNVVECLVELGPSDNLLTDALEVYEGFKKLYGEPYFLTLCAYTTVGVALNAMEFPEKALFIFSNVMKNTEFTSKASVINLRETKLNIALCLEKLGKCDDALKCLTNLKLEIESDASGDSDMQRKIGSALERLSVQQPPGN